MDMNVGGPSYSTLVRKPPTPIITSELWKGESIAVTFGVRYGVLAG